jgi:hypothetical protein
MGKRRKSEAQKEWMVWMRSPPGVSMARANRVRARDSAGSSKLSAWPSAERLARRASSPCMAHSPSRRNSRFCISEAAALV